jgi:hypothetical protein
LFFRRCGTPYSDRKQIGRFAFKKSEKKQILVIFIAKSEQKSTANCAKKLKKTTEKIKKNRKNN